ncbi:MAG: TonB-dependent receptor [Gammaproteobacteria bacterium]|nr:TonB-dependent receptor [Gammaproteobacteria bacterium]
MPSLVTVLTLVDRACVQATLIACSFLFLGIVVVGNEPSDDIELNEEVIVKGDPRDIPTRSNLGSLTIVDNQDLELARPLHPHEIFARTPGIWVVKNSGQEHLTGLRSAVLAGSGACGAYLLLEDNIPVRPIGFCNVNGLFELNIEQADRVAVLRGPASAIYGGNAMRGVINVRPFVGSEGTSALSLESGQHDYRQVRMTWYTRRAHMKFHATDTNGFRRDTGYAQQKLNVGWTSKFGSWDATHSLSMTSLRQETGGYVLGYQSYKDRNFRRANPNPEAFRNADSFRVSSQIDNGSGLYIYPYARMSQMNFLQHFLPGQPREDNEQMSAGAILFRMTQFNTLSIKLGAQLEWFGASLVQHQQHPTVGSEFLQATRPTGTHYDFKVTGGTYAVFQSATKLWDNRHEVEESLRVEHVQYQYDNRHLDGNSRDDGSICAFGGCLYTRPSDRSDSFTSIAARIGYKFQTTALSNFWVLSSIGYRPPQITELYRLQSGQTVADLKSENTRSVELGWQSSWRSLEFSIAVYFDSSSNLIFRDAKGMNVSDGATDSRGVEVEVDWRVNDVHKISVASTFSNHVYDFNRNLARGEVIFSGNQMDTAPRVLAHARWSATIGSAGTAEVEFNRIGSHYLNAANTARYGGHNVVNFRMHFQLSKHWSIFGRILNVFDTYYADRADFAFGKHRYFPADLRQFFVGIKRRFW